MGVDASTGISAEAARSWRKLSERIAGETDDRVRLCLQATAHHVVTEVAGRLDELMETLVPEPHYKFFGKVLGAPGPVDLQGADAIRAMYEDAIAHGGNRLEFELSCVVADSATVVTEGIFRQVYPGSWILELGLETEVEIEADGWYLVDYPALVVWPVTAEGLIEGERVYFGDTPNVIRAIGLEEYPHLGPADR